jgi:ADP-ribose pyrophosphatase YjhB (NUDIX family)
MRWPPRFCPDCGARLELEAGAFAVRQVQVSCQVCAAVHFRNAKPCAGVLIEREGRVLLARRAREPRKGTWDIVGGLLEHDEHPEAGAMREAIEETGLDLKIGELLGIYVDRYVEAPAANNTLSGDYTLNVYYRATSEFGEPRPADDVDRLEWFAPEQIAQIELSFPHESRVLEDWTHRLQKRGAPR